MLEPARHLPLFALLEALEQPGCPVCRLADQAARRFFEALFYEQVTDPQTRARLRRAGGFCRAHTAIVLQLGDSLGSSLIYADLLREAVKLLGGDFAAGCPACEAAAGAVDRALAALLCHLVDEDVLAAYRKGDGLCLEHLRQAISRFRPARRRRPSTDAARLIQIETERLGRLAAECEEFAAKSDYLRRGEPRGPESDAWQRAARKVGGGYPHHGT
jgi:hypothetical protein